jgi:hypothetical protein
VRFWLGKLLRRLCDPDGNEISVLPWLPKEAHPNLHGTGQKIVPERHFY